MFIDFSDSLTLKERRSRCPSTSVMMVRTQETPRTSTASRASPSVGTAPSNAPPSPTSSSAGDLYCTCKSLLYICIFLSWSTNGVCGHDFRPGWALRYRTKGWIKNWINSSVQTQKDEAQSVRVPGVGGRRSGAAQDVHQRTQPALLPQRLLHSTATAGDGGGQRGRTGPRLAQREDRQGAFTDTAHKVKTLT